MDFDFNTFTNLMTLNPERAMKYRDECHQTIKTQVKEQKVDTKEENTENSTNNIENIDYNPDDFTEDDEIEDLSNDNSSNDIDVQKEEKIEFTRADLIAKLENAGITYVKTSKDETLLRKCIENNLL